MPLSESIADTVRTAEREPFTITPWSGALGASIEGVDLKTDLDNDTMEAVKDAFARYQALSFPDQCLTPSDQVAFAARFGKIERYLFAEPLPDHPQVVAVTKEPGTVLNFGGLWHSDSPFQPIPPMATLLYAIELPKSGGDTMFANMYAAYDALSERMKVLLGGLLGVFCARGVHGPGTEDLKLGDMVRIRDLSLADKENLHPIVRTHPVTKRKALYASRPHIQRFDGMTEKESGPILDFLDEHAQLPEFTSRLQWQPGTLAIFDNRCVQHVALNDYKERRELHRVNVADDQRPF